MNIQSRTRQQVERCTSAELYACLTKLIETSRFALLPLIMLCAIGALAQSSVVATDNSALMAAATSPAAFAATESSSATHSSTALPEDPSAHLANLAGVGEAVDPVPQMTPQTATSAGPIAPKYTKYIPAGYRGQTLTGRDKFIVGVRDLYSPSTFLGEIVTAGYSQVLNGQPNYGTDKGAFGQRLGASALRDISEGLFTDSILSPVFHEDPRYYVEGPRYNFFHRTFYAATRPIITRTDSGKSTINAATLVGYAGASALSYTYYPEINKNFQDTAATFGGALAGDAIGFFVSEFTDDVLQALHIEKKH
jgi:hypothetical protein